MHKITEQKKTRDLGCAKKWHCDLHTSKAVLKKDKFLQMTCTYSHGKTCHNKNVLWLLKS